ncbi:hypothetical protein C8R43DRAFT_251466 [Mycena crocata]|nr:hypothetical protein C8R43DRAFT_251466 [Mycena crocata]
MARIVTDLSVHSELALNGMDFIDGNGAEHAAPLPFELDAIPSNIPDRGGEKETATYNTEESPPRRGRGRPRKDASAWPPRKLIDPNTPRLIQNFVNSIENNRAEVTAHSPPESDAIPFKIPGGAEESEGVSSKAEKSPPRRGRGRPRKDALPWPHRKAVDPSTPEVVQNAVTFIEYSPPESDVIMSNIPDQAKERDAASSNAEEIQPQRGRGRPRKEAPPVPPHPPRNPVDPDAPSPRRPERLRKVAIPEVKEEKPKRPRGRPRKHFVDPNAPKRPRGRPRKIIDPPTVTIKRPPGRPRQIIHPYAPPPEGTRRSPRKHVEPDMSPRAPEKNIVGQPGFFAAAMSVDVSEAESEPDVVPSLSAPPNDNASSSQQPTASRLSGTVSNPNVASSSATSSSTNEPSNDFLLKFLTGLSLQKWVEPFRAAEFDESAIRTFGGLPQGAFGAFLSDRFPTMSRFDRFILEGAVRDYVYFFQ